MNQIYRSSFFIVVLFFLTKALSAQNQQVSGTVTAKDDGLSMIGVNVIIKGTTRGTSTDIDGKYTLELGPGEDTLIFSYLGYITQTVGIGGRTQVDVLLLPNVEILEDVVVVGYGTQRKSD